MVNLKLNTTIKHNYDFVNYQTNAYIKAKSNSSKETAYSLVNEIVVQNESDENVSDLKVVFTSNSDIIKISDVLITNLLANSSIKISENLNVEFDINQLYRLREPLSIQIKVELVGEKDNTVYAGEIHNVIINPIDQIMSGLDNIDDLLLSCLVTPNAKEVIEVVNNAQKLLKDIRPDQTAFIGYQANSIDSVREEMMAIYNALLAADISYANPPASTNGIFQRVRLSKEVLETKRGTCLDLAILYCSCLESIGLNPILILIPGHAFAGCFLNDECFAQLENDSVNNIRNKSSVGNMSIELVECTAYTNSIKANFNDAVKMAKAKLELANMDSFGAVDIVKCHRSFYKPLPSYSTDEEIKIDFTNIKKTELESVEDKQRGIFNPTAVKSNKFDYWATKLLDLNLKNRLINFKLNNVAQVLCSDPAKLLKTINEKESLSFIIDESKLGINEYVQDMDFDFDGSESSGVYHVVTTEKSYRKEVKKSVTAMEETGYNTLYLAIGLIHYTPEKSKQDFLAPFLLVPIKSKQRPYLGTYQVEVVSDEITINTTCLEYIKNVTQLNFDELYNVTSDSIYENMVEIANRIRGFNSEACQISIELNKCFVSNFSFSHYIMWKDIRNRKDDMMKNSVIDALVKGEALARKSEEDFDLEELTKEVACPLNADSSQLKAIVDAEKGDSFVLDGPPGTGKSQTIVNMIVNAIYHGKTVLFVAEKMAALDVVQKRLADLKLDFLCLELHSNKSNKKIMLDKLKDTLEHQNIASPEMFDTTKQNLFSKREELNELVKQMRRNEYGISLYEAMLSLMPLKQYLINNETDYSSLLNVNIKDLDKIHDYLSSTRIIAENYGELVNNSFRIFNFNSADVDLDKLSADLNEFKDSISKLEESYSAVSEIFSMTNLDSNDINNLDDSLDYAMNNDFIYIDLAYTIIQSEKQDLYDLKNYTSYIESTYNQFLKYFSEEIFNADFKSEILEVNSNPGLFKRIGLKGKLKKKFRQFEKSKLNYSNELDVFNLTKSLGKLNEYLDLIKKSTNKLIKYLIGNYNYLDCPYEKQFNLIDNTYTLYAKANKFKEDKALFSSFITKINSLVETKDFSALDEVKLLKNNYDHFINQKAKLESKYLYNVNNLIDESGLSYLEKTAQLINDCVDNLEDASVVGFYNDQLNKLDKLNVPSTFANEYRLGKFDSKELVNKFDALYYKTIVDEYTKDKFFKGFNSFLYTDKIKKYGEAIENYVAYIVEETAARATENYPNSNSNTRASSTDIAKLKRVIGSGGRKTSIRNILSEYEDLIQTICPVFLMSPLSVAQYLSVDHKKFDIVIFDEASQIPTSEAVGAISRGNSLIVAGDPEQMPPTNFFKTNFDNNDDEEAPNQDYFDDLESLLDDCIAINMKRNRLLWHYRSQHESLISFSNNEFYNHELYTFPSPDNKFSRVEFVPVKNGIYNKSINQKEAEEILKRVEEIYQDPVLQHKSIGIITFNIKQAELIDDMIQKMFDEHPDYYKINMENQDQLFVKNLENVQGDERDIIMFSIGFGYNEKHKMNMNFGPLSLEKGERRLNVAVTRAREKMIVFSSIRGIDIRTEKAKNRGSSVLQAFLNYAEKGTESLIVENSRQTSYKVGIEKEIQEELKIRGIESDIDVGDSKFRVNLCVKDENDKYILGILIDGEGYINTPTCRDRNYVQSSMLKRLDWQSMRVYTYDYYRNKGRVIDQILEAISKAKMNLPKEESPKAEIKKISFQQKKIEQYPNRTEYEQKITKYVDPERYDAVTRIQKELENVIKYEGPISETELGSRFKDIIDAKAFGSRIKALFNRCLFDIKDKATLEFDDYGIYYYLNSEVKLEDIKYYRGSQGVITRGIELISPTEISNAAIDVINYQGAMSKEDLAREVCIAFGYEKVASSKLKVAVDKINYILKNRNYLVCKDDRVEINK